MKKLNKTLLVTCLLFQIITPLIGQNDNTQSGKIRLNAFGYYIGLIEYNINYERRIIQLQKSYTNIRVGFGYWTDLQEEGNYYNAALAHILGKNKSHLEFNLGVKYLIARVSESNMFFPDIYAGYRFEKQDDRFDFRAGFANRSFINIGIGFKI